jgi:hypothetical protein
MTNIEFVNKFDAILNNINITGTIRNEIDFNIAKELVLYYDNEKELLSNLKNYIMTKFIDNRSSKTIVRKQYNRSDLYISSFKKWLIENNLYNKENKDNVSKNNNKYVQMAMAILERIQIPTNDTEFGEWYMAKAKIIIGYAPSFYSLPFENTTLEAKVKLQDKYQMSFGKALMEISTTFLERIKGDENMQNESLHPFYIKNKEIIERDTIRTIKTI